MQNQIKIILFEDRFYIDLKAIRKNELDKHFP